MKTGNVIAKNVNENPCNMCMPLGGILPFKGIEQSMVILHGSQGCATYMRRHIAEHFNEPIDVASSSLNEKGTIYGGEANLRQAIDNVIKVYNPKIIGVLTTCLAETIGEDIERITTDYLSDKGLNGPQIVTVATPGYGDSHFEGYWLTLKKIVSKNAVKTKKHTKVNIILPNISPADIRELKRILEVMQVNYILLPDFSDTLDTPFSRPYKKIPQGGTALADIRDMTGATATIEMGMTVEDDLSPGKFLENEYGVPLCRVPIPIGVEATDLFINLLSEIAGKPVPETLNQERGRLLDCMIDSHKYNFHGRAAIFGEPELVYAVVNTCLENGVAPLVVGTGSKSTKLQSYLLPRFNEAGIQSEIIKEADFTQIRNKCKEKAVNIALGHSDGRYLTEKEGITLVRMGFPIHDRVGGQRILSVGYTGTAMFLDRITNTLLENKLNNYRNVMYGQFYSNS